LEISGGLASSSPAFAITELVRWAKAQHNSNYVVYSDVEPAVELLRRFIKDKVTHVVGIEDCTPACLNCSSHNWRRM
jgi:hypothetical protein